MERTADVLCSRNLMPRILDYLFRSRGICRSGKVPTYKGYCIGKDAQDCNFFNLFNRKALQIQNMTRKNQFEHPTPRRSVEDSLVRLSVTVNERSFELQYLHFSYIMFAVAQLFPDLQAVIFVDRILFGRHTFIIRMEFQL